MDQSKGKFSNKIISTSTSTLGGTNDLTSLARREGKAGNIVDPPNIKNMKLDSISLEKLLIQLKSSQKIIKGKLHSYK